MYILVLGSSSATRVMNRHVSVNQILSVMTLTFSVITDSVAKMKSPRAFITSAHVLPKITVSIR